MSLGKSGRGTGPVLGDSRATTCKKRLSRKQLVLQEIPWQNTGEVLHDTQMWEASCLLFVYFNLEESLQTKANVNMNKQSKMPCVTLKIGSEGLQQNECSSLLLGNDDWSNWRLEGFLLLIVYNSGPYTFSHLMLLRFCELTSVLESTIHVFLPTSAKRFLSFSLTTRKYITVH